MILDNYDTANTCKLAQYGSQSQTRLSKATGSVFQLRILIMYLKCSFAKLHGTSYAMLSLARPSLSWNTNVYNLYSTLFLTSTKRKKKKKEAWQTINVSESASTNFVGALQTLFSLLLMTLNWASHGDAMQYCYGNPNLLFWHQRLDDSSTNWKTILFNKNNKNLFKNWRKKIKIKIKKSRGYCAAHVYPLYCKALSASKDLHLKNNLYY